MRIGGKGSKLNSELNFFFRNLDGYLGEGGNGNLLIFEGGKVDQKLEGVETGQ